MHAHAITPTEAMLSHIELLVHEYETNLMRFNSEHPELKADIAYMVCAYREELFRTAALSS